MIKYSKIKNPTLAINQDIAINNIKQMMQKTSKTCTFRPHFKTHNNKRTATLFADLGINKITVSSIEMAKYFRLIGFKDITIAFPVNIREQKSINTLAKNTKLGLCISNFESIKTISNFLSYKCDCYIEIDTGYNRSGIPANNIVEIDKCIVEINKFHTLNFIGFINHDGRTYDAKSKKEILGLANESNEIMKSLKHKFKNSKPIISIGDTPSCSILSDFSDIDEIHPGNFVYNDLMQLELGVCDTKDIAATVLCPVVDINKERMEVVIHGGAVHFSKEFIRNSKDNSYGVATKHIGKEIFEVNFNITSLSQEHGIVKISDYNIDNIKIGDLLEFIPVHSCLAANLLRNNTLHY